MVRKSRAGMWFLLSSLVFSVCLCCGPPLSSTHPIKTREKEKEQTIVGEGGNIDKQRRQVDQDAGQAVDVFSPLTLYYHKRRDRDGEDATDLQMTHSLSSPNLNQSPTPVIRGGHVGKRWKVNNISDTSNATTPNTTAAAAVITAPHSVLSSSCSSPSCKWLASWQFTAVVSMTLAWLVALMALCLLTRTARGKILIEAWSSLCILDTKDQDEVQTKGIGYFDGSPGLRRFVLIEDENEEEEEEHSSDDLSIPEFKDVRSKGGRETESEGQISKKWTPPRRGTYILQEASREGVLEVGTYRLQEEEMEEEAMDRKKKKKKKEDKKKEEVEYILEGATYILQSERVGRGAVGGAGTVREGFGHIGGIEGLYGIVGREGLRGRGGFGRLGGLGVYGIMGRGEVRGLGLEGGRYEREEIEGLYEILQDRATGGGGEGDGVLLSVKELVRAMKGGEREANVIEESPSREGTSEELQEESEVKEEETGREVRDRGTSGAKMNREKGVGNRRWEGDKIGEVHMNDTWAGRREGGVRSKLGRVGEGRWEGRPPPPKRAASFPVDHFLSSHIIPRKLSLILEEETH